MAWYTNGDNELYEGATHTLGDHTYTGATRLPTARRLVRGPDPVPAPKPVKKVAKKKNKS